MIIYIYIPYDVILFLFGSVPQHHKPSRVTWRHWWAMMGFSNEWVWVNDNRWAITIICIVVPKMFLQTLVPTIGTPFWRSFALQHGGWVVKGWRHVSTNLNSWKWPKHGDVTSFVTSHFFKTCFPTPKLSWPFHESHIIISFENSNDAFQEQTPVNNENSQDSTLSRRQVMTGELISAWKCWNPTAVGSSFQDFNGFHDLKSIKSWKNKWYSMISNALRISALWSPVIVGFGAWFNFLHFFRTCRRPTQTPKALNPARIHPWLGSSCNFVGDVNSKCFFLMSSLEEPWTVCKNYHPKLSSQT